MSAGADSEYYESYWARGWKTQPPRQLVELFERHVAEGAACLDIGCGDGGTSGPWLSRHAASYVGVDISEAAVRLARDRGLEAVAIGDASDLPFAAGSFDFAVCSEVLEHVFDPASILIEVRRVLKPGGAVIVTVPNIGHWRNRLDLALLGRWNPRGDELSAERPWRDPHVRFFNLGALCRLMEDAGFEILERGGHSEHSFPSYVPLVRSFFAEEPSPRGRALVARFPRSLAASLYAVARA